MEVHWLWLLVIQRGSLSVGRFFMDYLVGCMSYTSFCVTKFAFVERSRTMKAPVGLLSDRTVLRSKMEGLCPDKFRVVELSRVYHTIPQSASKTKRTTDRSRWFLSSGGGWSIRNFTSQAPASFRSALVGACLLQTLPGTSTANWKLSA